MPPRPHGKDYASLRACRRRASGLRWGALPGRERRPRAWLPGPRARTTPRSRREDGGGGEQRPRGAVGRRARGGVRRDGLQRDALMRAKAH